MKLIKILKNKEKYSNFDKLKEDFELLYVIDNPFNSPDNSIPVKLPNPNFS